MTEEATNAGGTDQGRSVDSGDGNTGDSRGENTDSRQSKSWRKYVGTGLAETDRGSQTGNATAGNNAESIAGSPRSGDAAGDDEPLVFARTPDEEPSGGAGGTEEPRKRRPYRRRAAASAEFAGPGEERSLEDSPRPVTEREARDELIPALKGSKDVFRAFSLAIFVAVSFALGEPRVALSEAEAKALGDAIDGCFSTIPTRRRKKIQNALNQYVPWLSLCVVLYSIVSPRVALVLEKRRNGGKSSAPSAGSGPIENVADNSNRPGPASREERTSVFGHEFPSSPFINPFIGSDTASS